MEEEKKKPGLICYSVPRPCDCILGWPTYIVKIRLKDEREIKLGRIYYVGGKPNPRIGDPGLVKTRDKGMWRAWRCGEEFDTMREAQEECLTQWLEERERKG